jgi:hypothetical protein
MNTAPELCKITNQYLELLNELHYTSIPSIAAGQNCFCWTIANIIQSVCLIPVCEKNKTPSGKRIDWSVAGRELLIKYLP